MQTSSTFPNAKMSQKTKPTVSTKADIAYIRAVAPSSSSGSISGTTGREKNVTPIAQAAGVEDDWDDREEIRLRELEEARSRASQMEKTMRWWSDCTANWREKWSKVRNERNKAREENRHLRSKLEALVKECTAIKRDKQDLAGENEELKSQLRLYQAEKGDLPICIGNSPTEAEKNRVFAEKNVSVDYHDQLTVAAVDETKNSDEDSTETETKNATVTTACSPAAEQVSSIDGPPPGVEMSSNDDKLVILQKKLAECQKNLQTDKEEKMQLAESLEKLETELNSTKSKYEEVKRMKQETAIEMNKIQGDHKEEMSRIVMELEEETSNRTSMDRRLGEVRRELERLQRENTDEWGKRERLETERLAMERENKKLKNQIKDLEDQLERKVQQASTMTDKDMKTLQTEVSEKHKELNELRHTHARLKKAMQETTNELDHTKRRVEQYELEVKKLRMRVEEMRKDLATAEDEADNQANTVRRLQRTNDELQEQVENLQVQVEHLESRLKRSSTSSQAVLLSRVTGMKPYSLDHTDSHDSDADVDDDDS